MFSETVKRILANPSHIGPLEGATHCGVAGAPGEGPYMRIWLAVQEEKVEAIRPAWQGTTGQAVGPIGRICPIGPMGPIGEVPAAVHTITRAAFKTFGCPSATACGSMLCALLTGRDIEKAKLLTAADLLLVLGGLPEGREFCAELAVNAMRDAVSSSG